MPRNLIVGTRDQCRCHPRPAATIPGIPGTDGAGGAAGTDGSNAWASLTADFTMPAQLGNGVASLDHVDWLAPGEPVWIEGIGTLLVVSIAGLDVTLQNLQDGAGAYAYNVAPGTVAVSTLRVTPTGFEGPTGSVAGVAGGDLTGNFPNPTLIPTGTAGTYGSALVVPVITTDAAGRVSNVVPTAITGLPVADGGTGAATAANARTNLGAAASGVATASGLTVSATAKVLGRSSAGAGAVEEIDCTAAARTVLDDTTVALMRATLNVNRTPQDLIILRDQKASTTDGGTFTSGAWQTRDLNTEVCDTGNHCTLAGNQFTLDDGVYRITARAPAHRVDPHQIRLFDVVAAAVVSEGGLLAYGANADTITTADDITIAHLVFRFTVTAGPRAYTIQHRCTTTRATDGFGSANSFGGPEIYTEVILEREIG